ncbi:MAG TPA: HAMP domain-containing sensor histidine kinase [Candidatus Limnocylindria bacterium]|nr:HAMP domain-containing sensor histidine kinase [Candidatus Limnocylindria bacterium]
MPEPAEPTAPTAIRAVTAAPRDEPVPPVDATELAASEADARLVRDTRRRLVAFSGGSTLLVLVALGVLLYGAVANTLAAASVDQLQGRTDPVAAALQGQRADDPDEPFGFQPGRGNTFLFAFDSDGDAVQLGREPVVVLAGMPNETSLAAARTAGDGRNVWKGELDIRATSVPVRILTQRVTYRVDGQTYFLQALQDRSTEVQTLNALLLVLVVGGAVVVLVAVGFGAVYARRALVPIRESLAGQRTSLRRQREFAADASHELRTPLTVIRSSVELLRRNPQRPVADVSDVLGDIDAEVHHLTTLVEDLLLLARSDSGAVALERVPLHLDDLAADAAASLAQPAAAAGVRIEVDPAPTAAVGDPARLRQLVTILVDNAIRHSPRDGVVRVVIRPAGDTATLTVDDAGPGVAPEHRERVFDRFWRAPGAPAGGTGLGLAIARWIAEHHDGSISVDRSDAGGASFEVRLPSQPRPEASP